MDSGSGACSQLSVGPGCSSCSSPSGLCPPTTPQIPLHTLIFLPWILLVFQFAQPLLLDNYGQMTPHLTLRSQWGSCPSDEDPPAVSVPCFLPICYLLGGG